MKLPVFVAIVVSVALSAPADAASGKKHKKTVHRASVGAVQNSQDVYVGNVLVGRDPDPSIRAYLMRSPAPWDGPE